MMTYSFDFQSLPLRVIHSHRNVAAEESRPNDPETVITKTTYVYEKHRPTQLPANCIAVYHTKKGVWLALSVGTSSEVGKPELPSVGIIKVEHVSTH